jgi:hypothetical protein
MKKPDKFGRLKNYTYLCLMKKPESFTDLRKYLDNIPYINNGGCGLATLVMYRYLIDEGHVVKIVFANKSHNYENAITNIKFDIGEASNAQSAGHVFLFHQNKFIDCTTEIDISHYRYFEFVGEKKLLNAINNGGWNTTFDIKQYLPIIEYGLGIDLSDVTRGRVKTT